MLCGSTVSQIYRVIVSPPLQNMRWLNHLIIALMPTHNPQLINKTFGSHRKEHCDPVHIQTITFVYFNVILSKHALLTRKQPSADKPEGHLPKSKSQNLQLSECPACEVFIGQNGFRDTSDSIPRAMSLTFQAARKTRQERSKSLQHPHEKK